MNYDQEANKYLGVDVTESDFGMHILPRAIDNDNVFAYPFYGYWRDVGTVQSYWEANMELIGVSPELNLYDSDWPIWTHQIQSPPAKFVWDQEGRRGEAIQSMVSGGCIVSGAHVHDSLLFSRVYVHSYSKVTQSVILPDVDIGEKCHIQKAIIDAGAKIEPGTEIGVDHDADRERGLPQTPLQSGRET